MEAQFNAQAVIIENLERENARLSAELKYLEDQNCNLQTSVELGLKNIQKNNMEISKLRRQLQEREKELAKYSKTAMTEEDPVIRKGDASPRTPRERRDDELRRALREKDLAIIELERINEDLRKRLNVNFLCFFVL